MGDTTRETADAYNNKWVKRDLEQLRNQVERLQTEKKGDVIVFKQIRERNDQLQAEKKGNDIVFKRVREQNEQLQAKIEGLEEDKKRLEKQIKALNENHDKYRNSVNKMLIEQGFKVDWDGRKPTLLE